MTSLFTPLAHPLGASDAGNGPARAAGEPSRPAAPRGDVGWVGFRNHRGELIEAILAADGAWRVPDMPVLDRVLNGLFEPRRYADHGPNCGRVALERVAIWLKGTAHFESTRDSLTPDL